MAVEDLAVRALALTCAAAGALAGLTIATLGDVSVLAVLIAAAGLPVLVIACGGIERAFCLVLTIVLFGYAAVGRGFSYIGVPPFYVGELLVALAVAVLVLVRPVSGRRSAGEVGLWVLLIAGVALLAPDIGPFGIDALRDSVVFGYALVGLAVVRLWTPTSARAVQRTYERLAPLGVVIVVVRPAGRLLFPDSFTGPVVNGVNFLGSKPGEVAVQLSVFLTYLVLFRGRGIAPWTRSPAFRAVLAQIAIVGLLIAIVGNRGGMLAAFSAFAVAFAFSKRQVVLAAGGVAAVALMLVLSPVIGERAEDRRRSFSVEQIAANILSVVTNDDRSLSGTKEWRLEWWGDIIRSTTSGDNLVTGEGFGPNLAFIQGIESSPDGALRSPHNIVMTVLARGGLPFTLLWLLAVALAARAALVARRLARRRRLADRASIAALGALLLATISANFVNGLFDVHLEGPVGGMWFWAACGAAIGLAKATRPERIPRGAPVAMTSAGAVVGALVRAPDGTVLRRFLGVPYAAAPVGDLRWRAPQPPRPWTGTYSALSFAPAAPQGAPIASPLPGFDTDHPRDESCLALNVWTPGLHGARPVIVWVPGGAYQTGSTAQPVYDAALVAAESNAVTITVGYRLGALGFLDPEGDGVANCGLRDLLAALEWIRRHAAAFGGDPRNVTVMGESAGAGALLHLLASPASGSPASGAPPFQRAIVQSGQPTTLTAAQGRAVAEAFARHLGVARADADTLRSIPVDRLLAAQAATSTEMLGVVGPMAFAPVIDDDVCDGTIVDSLAAGRASEIPLVIGTTRDELALFSPSDDGTLDDGALVRRLERLVGEPGRAERIVAELRRRLPETATNTDIWNAASTQLLMRAPALDVADAHTSAGGTTFVYRFDWQAPGIGAAHAIDLPFTFGTADREGWDRVVGWDRRAEALAREWRASWSFFAATGDPSTPLRRWPQHDPERPAVMVFAAEATRVVEDLDDRRAGAGRS